ncbi:MAG TPA: hypothetical protein VM536_16450 [Chloroflexia bacterium]|nr:hypothetical protein [Chloroflexia bacterium]
MDLFLAWGVYLALGVAGATLAWAWLTARHAGRGRRLLLGLATGIAVLAIALTSQIPHDYRISDLAEYNRGLAAITAQVLTAIAGGLAAIFAVGRRRVYNAHLCAAGVYLVVAGLVLYVTLNGGATVQAPLLVLVGTSVVLAAGLRLGRLPRWLARAFGPAGGLVVALGVEALRGTGSPGGGPGTASPDALLLVGSTATLLLAGGLLLLRAHWLVLAPPLARAGAAFVGTGLVTALRGPGEWAPAPGAPSTTLYGLPLTLIVVAASLMIVDQAARRPAPPVAGPLMRRQARATARLRVFTAGLAGLIILAVVWRPAAEPCTTVPYADVSVVSTQAAWATEPAPSAPRRAPTLPDFDQLCTHRAQNASQIVYAVAATCKWAQVDAAYPLVQASGTLRRIALSPADSPWLHSSHDLDIEVAGDAGSAWLVVGGAQSGALLHVEAESGHFPAAYRPLPGDRVTVAGRWVFDCGHEPKTEIHPAAIVAGEHDEWRTDAVGGPQKARVLRVWMNSAPGAVHVPLAPFTMRLRFPTRLGDSVGTPMVEVVNGPPRAVRWTVSPGAGDGPEAEVQIVPPTPDSSAYFEVLLGYDLPRPAAPPPAYIITFDRVTVRDSLQRAARNTTGIPMDLAFPQLGFRGTGNWHMEAMVGHTWRTLLADTPVASGHDYPLVAVPPVRLLAPGDEHLPWAITGYAENDPSDGVQMASGSVTGVGVLQWDAGRLADICCEREQTFVAPHGAWTLTYHLQAGSR